MGHLLNFSWTKEKTANKYLSFFSPSHLSLQVLLFFSEQFVIWWTIWGRWNQPQIQHSLLAYSVRRKNSHHLLLLPEYCLIIASALLTCPPSHRPNTVHNGKESFIWILRNETFFQLAVLVLPGESDLGHPIDIKHMIGPEDQHLASSTSGWKRGSTFTESQNDLGFKGPQRPSSSIPLLWTVVSHYITH